MTILRKIMFARTALVSLLVTSSFGVSGALAESTDPLSIGTLKQNGIRHVSIDQGKDLISNNPDIIVIDVRTGFEFRRGHIGRAININYFSTRFRRQIRNLDPEKTYLVHCKSGHRSGRAAPIMKAEGFTNVIHMDGGFDAWKKAGLPVQSQ